MATVSSTGLVTAVTAGTTIIVASSDAASAAAVVIVTGAIAPGVTITFSKPTSGQVWGDTLPVFVSARSANRITGAIAYVGLRQITLTRMLIGATGAIDAWVGTLDLRGTVYGAQQIVVKATDSQNIYGIDSASFVRTKLVLGGSSPSPGKKQLLPVVPVKIP